MTETNGKFSQTPMNSAVARPKVEFTSAAEQHRTISPPPIEYGPSLEPPFYGTSSVLRWEWAEILPSIDTKKLFKSFLGGGELDAAAFEQAEKTEYMPAFQRLREEIEKDALIDSAAIYGYFPVITEDEKIILLDPGDFHTELAEFVFPRMQQNGGSSIADYLRPSGDLLAVQAVTAGQGIGRRATEFLNKEGPRMLGTFLNGIGVYLAGNLADRVTVELRRGLGLPDGAGRRFSFGQPGMPLLAEQQRLMEILAVEERLGIQLAEDFSLVPAHSALEIFIHHPNA